MSCFPVVAMWPVYKDQEKNNVVYLSTYFPRDSFS